MTAWTFLSVLSDVFSKGKLVIEEHNVVLICRAMKSSLLGLLCSNCLVGKDNCHISLVTRV